MVKYGGSFVKCLGACMSHADRVNMQKIKTTWPDYCEDYHAIGQKMRFEVCEYGECDGSGEVEFDGDDGEGHAIRSAGTRNCRCRAK